MADRGVESEESTEEKTEVLDDKNWGRNRTRDVVESGQVTKGLPEEVK